MFILTASGTGGMEAAIVNTLSPADKVINASCGSFGERFGTIASIYGADVIELKSPYGKAVDLDNLRKSLKENPDTKAVTVTHNETSTGIVNNIEKISEIVKGEFGSLLLVDGVSSVSSIPVRTDEWNCDVVATASQKGWGVPPGLAFFHFSSDAWDAHKNSTMPRYYFDVSMYQSYYKIGQPPFTPALSVMFAMDLALEKMIDTGMGSIFEHHSNIANEVIQKAIDQAKIKYTELDIVSYSAGPGIGPCLRVGATAARALSLKLKKPLVPVNHAIGHIELGCLLTSSTDPVNLLVSGGHTMILGFNSGRWRAFGETLDLTIGQLIDQIGRYAGYSSPAGATIEKLANESENYLRLPYSVKGNDVSFSGMLTSAKKMIDKGEKIEDVCFSLQETSYAMLAEVTERALSFLEKKEVIITGGVAASTKLKEMLEIMCKERGAKLSVIPRNYAGDCGAQIAWTGILEYNSGTQVSVDESWVRQSWRLDRVDVKWRK